MESVAVVRPLHYDVYTSVCLKSVLERPRVITLNSSSFSKISKLTLCGGTAFSSSRRHGSVLVSCVKTSETTISANSNGDPNGAVLSDVQCGLSEKKSTFRAKFPEGFEALLTEVCDETQIAELKVKYGGFEIHMKRNINGPAVPSPAVVHEAAPPAPTKMASASTPATPPPKSSTEDVSPFTNVSAGKAAKLAMLEAAGTSAYVIVSSPRVGSFRKARTLKGKKQPPACKEGDVIKEGQVIGFLDQLGTELPVKSDVAGEVLKLLYKDGEAVGYGDPLIAVLPSFPGINC